MRSRMYRAIRNFFNDRGFLEVETPLLWDNLIPESTIEVFRSSYDDPHRPPREVYLTPSPEVHMKQLLSRGSGSIYQIGKSFRNCEQQGRLHNPEFTLLEWYQIEADYRASMETTGGLLRELSPLNAEAPLGRPIRRLSMAEAFWDLEKLELAPLCAEGDEPLAGWREALTARGVVTGDNQWETLFNRFFLQFIEPRLPDETPLILEDYPKRLSCLAQDLGDSPWSQRWELYLRGVELANCYTEERDPEKIRGYYAEEAPRNTPDSRDRTVKVPHRVDPEYHRHFHPGFPHCSGTAMGLDRLLMILAGKKSLEGVILFPFPGTISRKN